MKYLLRKLLPVLFLVFFISCAEENKNTSSSRLSHDITAEDIQTHIAYLADDKLKGREAGTAGEVRAANYIADHFRNFGLEPAGDSATYFQEFTINRSRLSNPHTSDTSSSAGKKRIARNVLGLIRGVKQPDGYIIIGAHYDHLGKGAFGSLSNRSRQAIHNGADDNASGTAGMLELAQYFSRRSPERSLLFIGFSGEEMGLLGSQHFTANPTIPLDQAVAMINLDMIGRMKDNKLLIFGTGSSAGWEKLIKQANTDSLSIKTTVDGTGASDHTSFYNENIPVLHYFTGIHADYHRPSDDTEYINFEGTDKILEHVRRTIATIDSLPGDQLAYTEAPVTGQRNMTLSGVTLGVIPDYSFEGDGMRITGVRSNGPAGEAGLRSGDVIVKLNSRELGDIYEYMEVLNELEQGDTTTVTVLRDNKEITLDLVL